MGDQHDPGITVELDIADFSSKTVKRIDIQNIVSRADPHKTGIAVVLSFVDGSTGTILVRAKGAPVIAAPYSRPRMGEYSIVEEDDAIPVR